MAHQDTGQQDFPQLLCVHPKQIHQAGQAQQVDHRIRRKGHCKQGNGSARAKILGCRGSSHGHCQGGKCASSTRQAANEEHDEHAQETTHLHAIICHASCHCPTQKPHQSPTPHGMSPLQQEALQPREVLGTQCQQGFQAKKLEVRQERLTVCGG
jgi:hypothetical protein